MEDSSQGQIRRTTKGMKYQMHGMRSSSEYRIWCNMRYRCLVPLDPAFKDYGGRGIGVCERWMKFENFIADMGPRPSSKHSLDRFPNNDGNYEPGNCRWATKSQQQRNTRKSKMLTFAGETLTLPDMAEKYGLRPKLLRRRLEHGWAIEKALTEAHRDHV